MRLSVLLFAFFFWLSKSIGQTDTLRVMQYNLLNYGNSANPVSYKNPRLATIVQHVQPDVLGTNEMFTAAGLPDSVLKALGSGWSRAATSNTGGQTQINYLFYKSAKLRLRSQEVVSANLRDIIAYRLQYKDSITAPHDTIEMTVIVCHLKASSSSQDEADRAAETATIAAYIKSHPAPNYVVMGDMNVYYDTEPGYQNLVGTGSTAAGLKDPVNRPGYWHANSTFSDIHTQSPRTMTLGDGGVTGGLDDRFDQILTSSQIIGDVAKVKYLPGSYRTIGQDGQHYNLALTDLPTNTAAPAGVIQALYEMSDHLPVTASFIFHTSPLPVSVPEVANSWGTGMRVENPFRDQLRLFFPEDLVGQQVGIELYNALGQQIFTCTRAAEKETVINAGLQLASGMYLIRIVHPDGGSKADRVILQ